MKILISGGEPEFNAEKYSSTFVHIAGPGSDLSRWLGGPQTIDVWICDGEEVTVDLMNLWSKQSSSTRKFMLVRDTALISKIKEITKRHGFSIEAFPDQHDDEIGREESILRHAEKAYVRACADQDIPAPAKTKCNNQPTVLLVGAGIINLMTAELLATNGFRVHIVDKGPDPRSCEDWTRLGVTHGGGNARMFTHTEADNYNEKGSQLYSDMKTIFRRTARNGGWSVKSPLDFFEAENAWVNTFEQIPAWLAKSFRDDIYEVNREAGQLWNEYMEDAPELFDDVGLCKDIMRLYADEADLKAAINLTCSLGTIIREHSIGELMNEDRAFQSAAVSNHLAGAITVQGFTVNIHLFVARLIDRISRLGGEFTWNCEVHSVQRDANGKVENVMSQLGPLIADHYVISPGASGNALLKGTRSEDTIQGVLGVWLQIPNLHPQTQHSIKIHRRGHLVEDINITLGKDPQTQEDILIFGGGYGFTGLDRPADDSPELLALFKELEEVARICYPDGYALAKERGTLWPRGERKFCVRPFTATGLGVFESMPTVNGGQLIITGGNNTGGFAQAPAVARAVLRKLIGECDPIHLNFHPDRGRLPSKVTYKSRVFKELSLRQAAGEPPLKLLLLCNDGPQQQYLRSRLDQAFPGYRCIIETQEGQIRNLVNKGRHEDADWMKYHDLRRRRTGADVQRKAYFDNLIPPGHTSPEADLVVDNLNCRQVWAAVDEWKPEMTIVVGTKFIGKKLIERAGLMINLHTGHLPEYKGSHCIFFALCDGAVDKIAATLHQLTSDLDGGAILDRVFPIIYPADTEDMLYTRCAHLAIDRCIERVQQFASGEKLEFVAQTPDGKAFRHCDRTPEKELWLESKLPGLLGTHHSRLADDKH